MAVTRFLVTVLVLLPFDTLRALSLPKRLVLDLIALTIAITSTSTITR